MFRILGAFFIIITCTLCGIYKYLSYKERLELIQDFRNMLLHLETEINYFKEPLPYIFKKISVNKDTEGYLVLKNIVSLNEQEIINLEEAWSKSIDAVYGGSALKTGDAQLFKKVGGFIGQSDLNGQKGHFDALKNELENVMNESVIDLKTKGRMYAKMGISMGIIVAIVVF